MSKHDKIKIFLDDSCYACHAEMNQYRKWDTQNNIEFIDISDPSFHPEPYGRTLKQLMAEMHVMGSDGRFYKGIDAFIAIWKAMPLKIFHATCP